MNTRTNESDALSPLLTTGEVASLTRLTKQHLHRLRMQGKGPRFIRVSENAVRYRRCDVAAYLESRLSPEPSAAY